MNIRETAPRPQTGRGIHPAATRHLTVSIGQHADKGRKDANQDFHGALIPEGPTLALKGITIAIADGISTSTVSRDAAETAVKSFLTDYYCTSDGWTVKTAAQRVISATNAWLHASTRRSAHAYEMDRGYVSTFTGLVLKARSAHIFHVGDCRLSRLSGQSLEPLTEDHRLATCADDTYLARALGVKPQVEIDYRTVPLSVGDIFVMSSDGVHDFIGRNDVAQAIAANPNDLDAAARQIVEAAFTAGSPDNLTVQIVRIDALPEDNTDAVLDNVADLLPPPLPEPRSMLDGYRILRQLYASPRSHVYLALDTATDTKVVVKVPAIDVRNDSEHLKRFMMEEWIARRVDSPHVLKAPPTSGRRNHLYVVTEWIEGQTLAQWMVDHPKPELEKVRDIADQIAKGLRAFHRLEMLHQDLRPQNIMIDAAGTVTLIDFGSVRVAGVVEAAPEAARDDILGTAQYTAPEYFVGERGTSRSDLFSLAVIVYQMLTGRLPYGAEVAKTRTRLQQSRLRYVSTCDGNVIVPPWMDGALMKALQPNPQKRTESLSEFTFDLRRPNPAHAQDSRRALAERDPVLFWKCVAAVLALAVLVLLWRAAHASGV